MSHTSRLVPFLVLVAALGAAAIWWAQAGTGEPPPAALPDAQGAARAAAGAATAAPAATRLDATVAAEVGAELLVTPADAPRVDVHIVLADSGEPVADAEVEWTDELSRARLEQLPPDRQQRARAAGLAAWHGRSDSRGIVRVHLGDPTEVRARKGELTGSLDCYRDTVPPEGFRVELFEDRPLQVRVRDGQGRPVAGVELRIRCEGARSTYATGRREYTGPDGLATFEHLRDIDQRRNTGWERARDEQWIVQAATGDRTSGAATFDPLAPPRSPIDLTLPPCGSVRVRVESGGTELTGRLSLRVFGDGGPNMFLEPAAGDGSGDGVLFPFVVLGREVEATARLGPLTARERGMGPRQVGEQRVLVISLDAEQPVLTGRLVDAARQPLGNRSFRYDLPGCTTETSTTDAEGRFRFAAPKRPAPKPGAGRPQRPLRIEVAREPEPPLRGELVLPPLRPGLQNLGDLRLEAWPLLVRGRFVAGGQPAEGQYWVEVQCAARAESDRWQAQQDVDLRHAAGGVFSVYGVAGPGPYRLDVLDYRVLPRPPIVFSPGTDDLVVPIDLGAPLIATLLAPDDLPPGVVVGLGPEGQSGEVGAERLRPWISEQKRGRSSVEWRGLPPGKYSLEVRLYGFAPPLRTFAGIEVPQPAPADPRLVIDLRQDIETLTLRTRSAYGEADAATADGLLMSLPLPDTALASAWSLNTGYVQLVVPARAVDLLVVAQGFQPQRATGVRGSVTVALQPWPAVELVLAPPVSLPEGFELRARLQGDVEPRRYRLVDDGDERLVDLGAPAAEPVPFADGRARLAASGQSQRLVVTVFGRADEGVQLERVTPSTIVAGPAAISVRLDGDEVHQAIERLR
ncbi:MAG TPA: hypothetical protein VFZ65_20540 [Planctomycetota bacterium]|nr:hypothetical protein [Planctomycetota bacterium]